MKHKPRPEQDDAERIEQGGRKDAVGYVRVSTEQQGARKTSLEAQGRAIETFADDTGYNLLDTFQDVASGAGEESFGARQGLQDALALARAEKADVIVWSWDRLSRYSGGTDQIRSVLPLSSEVISVKDANTLQKASEAGRLQHAQDSRDNISRTTKKALQRKKEAGVQLGNPEIATVQVQGSEAFARKAQQLVEKIAEVLRTRDYRSLSAAQVADLLNDHGLKTMQNKDWNASRVRPQLKKAKQLLEDEDQFYSDNPNYGAFS